VGGFSDARSAGRIPAGRACDEGAVEDYGGVRCAARCAARRARALRVSADSLVFEQDERGPDEEFRSLFETFTAHSTNERQTAKTVFGALIRAHHALRQLRPPESESKSPAALTGLDLE